MRRALKLALGLAIGGVFLWLTLRHVDFGAVITASRLVNWQLLALAPVCLSLGYICRVLRWRLMLLPHNPALGFGRATVAFVGSIAVNNLAPFRLGDVMRCFAFSGWLGIAPGAVVASMLVERLLDLVALVVALGLAVWLLSVTQDTMGIGLGWVAVVLVLGGLSVMLLAHPPLMIGLSRALLRLANRFGPAITQRAAAFLEPLITGLSQAAERRMMTTLIVWTLPIWFFEAACYRVTAQALPDLPEPGAAWLAMPVGTLATLLPSTPGHIGTFDYFAQAATLALGNPLVQATAFVLIVRLVLWLTTTLTGSLCLLIWALARGKTRV